MKRIVALALILGLVAFGAPALAQQASPGAPVSQTGSTGLAAQTCLATGTAMNSTAQQTLTVPSPGGGNSVYFDYLLATLNTVAAPASSANVFSFTTTNIAGTPFFPVSLFGTAVSGGNVITAAGAPGPLSIPIKALAGASPTVVGPTANATYGQFIQSCWHVAP
jgi:hypothetical protein